MISIEFLNFELKNFEFKNLEFYKFRKLTETEISGNRKLPKMTKDPEKCERPKELMTSKTHRSFKNNYTNTKINCVSLCV